VAWHRALVRRHPNLRAGCLHLPAGSGLPALVCLLSLLACPPRATPRWQVARP
jgi:hypothetical protein